MHAEVPGMRGLPVDPTKVEGARIAASWCEHCDPEQLKAMREGRYGGVTRHQTVYCAPECECDCHDTIDAHIAMKLAGLL